MLHRPAIVLALLLTCFIAIAPHTYACYVSPTKQAAIDATVINSETREASIERLREAGPEGLKALVELRDVLVASLADAGMTERLRNITSRRIALANEALDAVAQQRYGHVSKLYWHTDLDAALTEAKQQNKPVLSLQMLGKLTEEYSCANSRFFRVLLYADPRVSDYLRENYVLHWRSVRDVPVVTITLVDGSTMKRTITGNSAHFVLDSEGRTLNIIPGLWRAEAFLEEVTASHALAEDVVKEPSNRDAITQAWHRTRQEKADAALATMLKDQKVDEAKLWRREQVRAGQPVNPREPMAITASKWAGEMPAIKAADLSQSMVILPRDRWQARRILAGQSRRVSDITRLIVADNLRLINNLAPILEPVAEFAMPVQQLILQENPTQPTQPDAATYLPAGAHDDRIGQLLNRTRNNIAADTFINRYGLQREVHNWFINGVASELPHEKLVDLTYNVLFMMDLNDPWAGLYDPTIFTGLQDGGITTAVTTTPTAITAKRD